MIWKFSAASVALIPDLYRRYGYGLFGEALPRVFNETDFLDTPLRQWVALPVFVGVGYGLGLLITNLQIENLARCNRFWYHPTLNLRYETTPDQIRYVLVEVRRLLYAHPKVDSASARVRFIGFGSSSLDLEVSSYVTVTDGPEYLEVAEDLNLRIMNIVAAAASSFAFPSQTTYVEQDSGLDPDRARAAEARVQEWRERSELYLPRFPPEKIAEINNTLSYFADG